MDQIKLPEGDRIYDLYTGVYKPQVIRIALTLDIFSPLKAGPATADSIARACHCEKKGIHHLLDYLSSINLLLKDGEEYSLTAEAATFLVRGEKSYTGDLIIDFISPAPWDSVMESIHTGEPRNVDKEVHFAQDAWIESFRSNRIQTSLDMWSEVKIIPEGTMRVHLLDIACGCAIKSMVLVKQSPGVVLTCLDTALVLESARDLATRWGILPRVRFIPDNLLTADIGINLYDCCLLGQITHYLTQHQNKDLFKRIYEALREGGVLVLDVPMSSDRLDESSSFLSLLLWANSGGCAYRFEDYRSWLMEAGFIKIKQHSERLLSALR
jgi:3-hydroxy-5-methyl-1-naphthoate 3-O-methyltransferase